MMKALILMIVLSTMFFDMSLAVERRLAKRRLSLPDWAKNGLKNVGHVVVNTVIDCVADELKSVALDKIKAIPGLSYVAGKVAGPMIDKISGKIKTLIDNAIDKAVDGLRRRRRLGFLDGIAKGVSNAAHSVANTATSAAHSVAKTATSAANTVAKTATSAAHAVSSAASDFAKTVEQATKDAAANAAKFAGEAAKAAANVANEAHKLAVEADKLTGGKLSAFLASKLCPVVADGVKAAAETALKSVGWPLPIPACLITAIKNGCEEAVKAAFKRYRRRLRHRKL